MTIILLPVSSGPLTWYEINFEVVFAYLLVNFQFLLVTICVPSAPFLSRPVFGRLSFRCGLDVTDSCQWWPGFTPWLPPRRLSLQTAAWETTGHQAGASLYGLEQGSRPNQYLCISCPFAQVSSLIITAWRSFNALAGWAKGRGWVTFPRPWLDLDHTDKHGERHNKATQMTLPLIHAGSSSVAKSTPNAIKKNTFFCSCAYQQWYTPGRTWLWDIFTTSLVPLFNLANTH